MSGPTVERLSRNQLRDVCNWPQAHLSGFATFVSNVQGGFLESREGKGLRSPLSSPVFREGCAQATQAARLALPQLPCTTYLWL